jgi:hypothetical protein
MWRRVICYKSADVSEECTICISRTGLECRGSTFFWNAVKLRPDYTTSYDSRREYSPSEQFYRMSQYSKQNFQIRTFLDNKLKKKWFNICTTRYHIEADTMTYTRPPWGRSGGGGAQHDHLAQVRTIFTNSGYLKSLRVYTNFCKGRNFLLLALVRLKIEGVSRWIGLIWLRVRRYSQHVYEPLVSIKVLD